MIADVEPRKAGVTVEEIGREHGGQAVAVAADVSDQDAVDAMVRATIERFHRVDILVNNAGICPLTAWGDASRESWDRILAVNLTGAFLCTRAVLPFMRAQHDGRIVFISSEGAFTGSKVAHVAYGVSKAGLLALMKSVAKGFAADGIRANAVAPGPIDTPLAHALGRDFWNSAEARTLLKRHGACVEVADTVLFLVSDASSYITGQVLRVNGGADLA
jgi:3-oxoacyl-[acyl-carrier protein] reductase